jgi:hypothetical protein
MYGVTITIKTIVCYKLLYAKNEAAVSEKLNAWLSMTQHTDNSPPTKIPTIHCNKPKLMNSV